MFLCAVDVRDRKDLGVHLQDTTIESGLTNMWENERDIVERCTKRWKWLGDEEKRTMELTLRPRFVSEDCQLQARGLTSVVNG